MLAQDLASRQRVNSSSGLIASSPDVLVSCVSEECTAVQNIVKRKNKSVANTTLADA